MEVTDTGADTGTPRPLSVSEAANKLNGLFNPEKSEKPEPVKAEQVIKNSEATAEEAVPESSETETEATEEAEGQETNESQDDSNEATAETLTSLSDIAQKLGLDSSLLYDIKIPVKVDGKDGEATLADVIRRYQTDAHLTHEGMKLADSKKEVQKQLESIETERQTRLGHLDQAALVAQQLILGEYKNIDWEKLRAEDPIGYLEKKNQFQEYHQAINQIVAAQQAERQRDQEARLEKLKASIKEQQEKLVAAIPSWKDSSIQKKEYNELLDFLRTDFGVTKEELNTLLDHRIYVMAAEAKKYRELQKKNPKIENKDRTPPKIAKAGSAKPNHQAAKAAETRKNFMRNKDVKSAGAHINSLFKR